jgi:hypothetical protein
MANMTVNAFNTAAKPYIFDLDREVAAFYRDHPALKRKLFFIDGSTLPGTLYRGEETDEDEVADLLSHNPVLLEMNKLAQKSGSRSDLYPKQDYGCVLFNFTKPNQQNFLGYRAAPGMSEAFIFDHEAGHLLCEKGLGNDANLAESVADAYATIRHIQRFGRDSAAIQRLLDKRAVGLTLCGAGDHFTGSVVEKIIADSLTVDFAALTPAETVERAQRYAEDNIMDPALIRRMVNDFDILGAGVEGLTRGDFSVIRYMADFVLHPVIPEEAKWAAVAVRALLDGDTGIFGARLPKPVGPEWTKLRQDIDSRAARFEQPQKLIVVYDPPSL